MRVAINCRNLSPEKLEGFGTYTSEVCSRLIAQNPSVEFLLLYDRIPKHPLPPLKNVRSKILGPATRHPLLYWFWFEYRIPRILKQEKIDLFFSPDGYNSLRSNVPSLITVHDLNFVHNPQDLPFLLRAYLRSFFPRFVKKAKHVITVSEYSKKDIIQSYRTSEDKLSVIYNAPKADYSPLDEVTKQRIRDKWTQGKSYFLFVGSLHPRKNVQRLIDAYGKLNQSDVELVIVGGKMWKDHKLILPETKKDQIRFLGYLPSKDVADLMGSALALTYVPYFEGFGIPLVEAMACGTPILAANSTCLPEIAGEAAIFCDPMNVEDINAGMQKIMGDEALRNELSTNGLNRVRTFNWDKAAEKTWNAIQQVLTSGI